MVARLVLLMLASVTLASATLFGSTPAQEYLLGMFDPSKHGKFAQVKSFSVVLGTNDSMYIRSEAGAALETMLQDFTALTGIPIPVYGATYNFTSILASWEEHFFDSYSPLICNNTLERCLAVLQVTSMPGTSRHSWGSEVDLFSPDRLNSDFLSGNGSIFYQWMTLNAAKYGFYEPYNAGRCAGYGQQKWHWSYKALAAEMLREWNKYFGNDVCSFLDAVTFTGNSSCGYLAPVYVKTINPLAGPDWNAPPTDWPLLAIIVVFVLATCFTVVTVMFLVLLIKFPTKPPPTPTTVVEYAPVAEGPTIN